MEDRHAGVMNAYRTLYLTAGADATVIGSNLAELDLGAVQGRNETRLSVLSRVPASLLGISEGLAGSSLNAGNFSAARRNFADTWVYPVLQDLANSLAPVVKVPADAELWYDVADMPILREDAKDAADIEAVKAVTIAVMSKKVSLLRARWRRCVVRTCRSSSTRAAQRAASKARLGIPAPAAAPAKRQPSGGMNYASLGCANPRFARLRLAALCYGCAVLRFATQRWVTLDCAALRFAGPCSAGLGLSCATLSFAPLHSGLAGLCCA